MCQKITILNEVSASRYISQCEHGTVHLLWDCIGIHISELNFRTLARNMEFTWVEHQKSALLAKKMWLKVAQIVLQIETHEFVEILRMVQEAIHRMDAQLQAPVWMQTRFGPLDHGNLRVSVN